jgi:hypothetical protein
MEHGIENVGNLKLISSYFEQLSGSKINFHKSELFCFRQANLYAKLFANGQGQT